MSEVCHWLQNHDARIAFAFSCAVAFTDGADTQSFAIAAPVIARDVGVAPAAMGIIFATGAFGIAVGAVICGRLADHWGPKRVLAMSTLCFGIFQLATYTAEIFALLLALRVLAGFGLGSAAPCFLALTTTIHLRSDAR